MAPTARTKSPPRKSAAKSTAKKAAKKAPAKPRGGRSTAPAASSSAAPQKLIPVAPEGLGPVGGRLWHSVCSEYELRPDELRVLEDACREALLIDRLDRELAETHSLIARGSMGQPVASPLVQEIRQHRMTFASLTARLKLEDLDGEAAAARSARARSAANARWRRDGA